MSGNSGADARTRNGDHERDFGVPGCHLRREHSTLTVSDEPDETRVDAGVSS